MSHKNVRPPIASPIRKAALFSFVRNENAFRIRRPAKLAKSLTFSQRKRVKRHSAFAIFGNLLVSPVTPSSYALSQDVTLRHPRSARNARKLPN